MNIVPLDPTRWAGTAFTARYLTRGYYDVCLTDAGFSLLHKAFPEPQIRAFEDVMLAEWLDHPVGFGAFEQEVLVGFVEGFHETWNNRFRISNLCVLDEGHRRSGVGSALMTRMLAQAKSSGARMAVLETQSCNENAIAFYRKQGFQFIGLDLYAYRNDDPERHEVRMEMGRFL